MKKIAYCILTHNHPNVIEEVIINIIFPTQKYNIDIYIYDSSDNNLTRKCVDAFNAKGHTNLYYIKLDSKMTPVKKIPLVFQGFGFVKEYDFIWPAKDRTFYLEEIFCTVSNAAEEQSDCIFLGVVNMNLSIDEKESSKKYYGNATNFFKDWAWLSTSLDVTLFNYNSLLKDIEWESFQNNYFYNNQNTFPHYTVLFHQLAKKQNPSILVLMGDTIVCFNVNNSESSYIDKIFKVWGEYWIKITTDLPSCYDKYKSYVIKQAGMLPWIFGSYSQLIKLQQQNILTPVVFKEIVDNWERLSAISLDEVEMIAYGKYNELFELFLVRFAHYFEKGEYENACIYHNSIECTKPMWQQQDLKILDICFNVYKLEKADNEVKSIFENIYDYKEIVCYVQTFLQILKELETDLSTEISKEVIIFFMQNTVSKKLMAYLIFNQIENKDKVLSKIALIYSVLQK